MKGCKASKKGFVGFLLSLVACTPSKSSVSSITAQEAYGALQNDFAVLIDIREDDEIKAGMAAPAKWVPTTKIEANAPEWQQFVKQLPKDRQIIIYCAKGGRAGRVAASLAEQGFKTANMGGYRDWVKAGLPIKKP